MLFKVMPSGVFRNYSQRFRSLLYWRSTQSCAAMGRDFGGSSEPPANASFVLDSRNVSVEDFFASLRVISKERS